MKLVSITFEEMDYAEPIFLFVVPGGGEVERISLPYANRG